MEEVDKMYPDKFRYILIKDGGVTGNLELTVQKNSGQKLEETEQLVTSGKSFHTKQGGNGYPSSDWEAFHSRLEDAMASC